MERLFAASGIDIKRVVEESSTSDDSSDSGDEDTKMKEETEGEGEEARIEIDIDLLKVCLSILLDLKHKFQ